MIFAFVREENELPPESATAFASWLHEVWDSFNEDGDLTNRQVLEGALFE
jgi:hypothetical protein